MKIFTVYKAGIIVAVTTQLLIAITIAVALFVPNYYLELFISFARTVLPLLGLSLIVTTIAIVTSKTVCAQRLLPALVGLAWIVTLSVIGFSLSLEKPIEKQNVASKTIRFATFNKLYSNTSTDFITFFQEQPIDVLALQETQADEANRIAEQLGFDYVYITPTIKTAAGTASAIVSRYPFESAETIELAPGSPVGRAVITISEDDKVIVYSVHLPGPFSSTWYDRRNRVIESLAETVKQETLPVLLGGDFNTTTFSPALQQFNQTTASTVRPVTTSKWPTCSWYGYGNAFCIRIDHVYISNDARLIDTFVAPDLGSDHRAIVTTVAL